MPSRMTMPVRSAGIAASRRPSAPSTAGTISDSDATGASSTIQTPSATRGTHGAVASRASRVLPAPPGPSSVTSRLVSSSAPIWAISRSRPTKLVTGAGRFVRPTLAAGACSTAMCACWSSGEGGTPSSSLSRWRTRS